MVCWLKERKERWRGGEVERFPFFFSPFSFSPFLLTDVSLMNALAEREREMSEGERG